MPSLKPLAALAATTLAVGLLAGCASGGTADPSPGTGAGAGSTDAELTVARRMDVTNLDADAVAAQVEGAESLMLIADGLFGFDHDGKVVPRVAEGYDYSEDHKQLTVKLRDGVVFADGTAVTSKDVKFTLEHAKEGPLEGNLYTSISGIQTPDDQTVVIDYATASSESLLVLAGQGSAVVPADFGGKTAEEFWKKPNTVGPFKLDTWEQGVGMTLARNEKYYGDKPKVAKINFVTVPDENTRLLQLQNGTVDLLDAVTPQQVPQLDTGGQTRAVKFDATRSVFLTFNTTRAPFDNPDVRRAISYAIDREALAKAGFGGLAVPSGSVVTGSAIGGYVPESGVKHDVAAAKAALAKAGQKDLKLEILYTQGDSSIDASLQIVQDQLKEAGITVTLTAADRPVVVDRQKAKNFDSSVANIISSTDIGTILGYYGATDGFRSYDTAAIEKVTALSAEANADFGGQDARNAIFRKALDLIADDAIQVGLVAPQRLYAAGTRVVDAKAADPTGQIDYRTIEVR